MKRIPEPREWAFTLAEILIATGLFSVAALGVAGLLTLAGSQETAARNENRSTEEASGILENLLLADDPRHVRIAVGMSEGKPVWKIVDPEKTDSIAVTFDDHGNPLEEIDSLRIGDPVGDGRAFSIASVSFRHKSPVPELVTAEVCIGSPAAAPQDRRDLLRFVRRIPAETP